MPNSASAQRVDLSGLEDGDLTLQPTDFAPHRVHHVPTYHFRMVHSHTGEEIGGINLRLGSTPHIERYAGHIGFTVHPAHRGHRYAARSVRILMPIAGELGFDTLWITCDPGNIASRRSLELAAPILLRSWMYPSTASSIGPATNENADIGSAAHDRRYPKNKGD